MIEKRVSIPILDQGSLALIDYMGDDQRVLEAARVSKEGGVRHGEPSAERDERLLEMLAKEHHTSVFEHCVTTFYVCCPIFVRGQWHRHRTQSYNEVSGRYSKTIFSKFFVPDVERLTTEQTKDSRQGNGKVDDKNKAEKAKIIIEDFNESAYKQYHELLKLGVPKELARTILPLGTYTEFYATSSLLNWSKFLKLRIDNHAQYEIRQYANQIFDTLSEIYPLSMKYLDKYLIHSVEVK